MAVGTYLVVEKLRLLAYRNLCRRVHSHLAREHDQGRAEFKHKQDLEPYEVAFAWQDGFDSDETICLLARLITLVRFAHSPKIKHSHHRRMAGEQGRKKQP